MRYAIISDIHSNLQALETVLENISRLGIERILCLGDIVGYGGDPSACIALVSRRCETVIMGNHDAAAVELTPVEYFNPVAFQAALWTSERLAEEEKEYLRALPYSAHFEEFCLVHSSPDSPKEWRYLLTEDEAGPRFGFFTEQLLLFGHTHLPMTFIQTESGAVNYSEAPEIELRENCRYLVNVCSVGQPRDGDPRASFGILDTAERRVTILRESYDILSAQRRIIEQGLPAVLAERLAYGS